MTRSNLGRKGFSTSYRMLPTGLLSLPSSISEDYLHGVIPPIVGWTFSCQSLLKSPPVTCLQANQIGEIFSIESPSSQTTLSCFVDKQKTMELKSHPHPVSVGMLFLCVSDVYIIYIHTFSKFRVYILGPWSPGLCRKGSDFCRCCLDMQIHSALAVLCWTMTRYCLPVLLLCPAVVRRV